MKLLYTTSSPYVRKVRVAALEKGLGSRIELVAANPWPDPTAVVDRNPLGKVPVLVADDGLVLYDSPVICEYLDTLSSERRLIPAAGRPRWAVLRCQALADGILDAAVTIVLERRRAEAERSVMSQKRAIDAIRRSLAALPGELKPPDSDFDLGQIAIAVALGYLEFRLGDLDLGAAHGPLAAWWSTVQDRPSLVATRPS